MLATVVTVNEPTIEFIGVYDADATLLGEVSYWIGARFGRRHCSLCDLTHGTFRMKSEWKVCSRSFSTPFVTYHRNDAPDDVLSASRGSFPVVLARRASGLHVLLGSEDLDRFGGSTARFIAWVEEQTV